MSVVSRVERLQRARTPANHLELLQKRARGYPLGTQKYPVQGLTPLGDKRAVVKRFVKPIEPRLQEGSDLRFEKRISPTTPDQRGAWQANSPVKFEKRISPVKRSKPARKDWTIRKHGMKAH